MRELTLDELDEVSGGRTTESVIAFSAAAAISKATFGSGWATMAAVSAFGASPLIAATVAGLAVYGGYQWFTD